LLSAISSWSKPAITPSAAEGSTYSKTAEREVAVLIELNALICEW
jgi:hypothetical protein